MTEVAASPSEWLGALQRLAGRVAHEIKNPLNAVAVNLEVVRSRCERGTVDPSGVVPYATAAAREAERVARLVDALLAAARPARDDLAILAGPLVTLYDALANADGGSVVMDLSGEEMGIDMPADDARAAVALILEGMLEPGAAIRVHISRDGDDVAARFSGPRIAPKLPVEVRLRPEPTGVTLLFPARTPAETE